MARRDGTKDMVLPYTKLVWHPVIRSDEVVRIWGVEDVVRRLMAVLLCVGWSGVEYLRTGRAERDFHCIYFVQLRTYAALCICLITRG